MITKKQFLKSKPIVKVSLSIPADEAIDARTIHVVGDFNAWDTTAHPMKKSKTGEFKTTLELDINKEHQFRYLINGEHWFNESAADKFVPSGVSSEENAVLVL